MYNNVVIEIYDLGEDLALCELWIFILQYDYIGILEAIPHIAVNQRH